jgi:hypothetical protein
MAADRLAKRRGLNIYENMKAVEKCICLRGYYDASCVAANGAAGGSGPDFIVHNRDATGWLDLAIGALTEAKDANLSSRKHRFAVFTSSYASATTYQPLGRIVSIMKRLHLECQCASLYWKGLYGLRTACQTSKHKKNTCPKAIFSRRTSRHMCQAP